jgi:hypothetical protein
MIERPWSSGTKASPGDVDVGREELGDQIGDEPRPLLGHGRGRQRGREPGGAPAGADRPPAAAPATLAGVELAEERRVPHPLARAAGVLEDALGEVHPRHRRLRMEPPYVLHVLPQDRGLHAARPDHVVGHEQEALPREPGPVLRDGGRQLGHRAHVGVVLEHQMQHRHEVALAAPEAPVEIRRLAAPALGRARMNPSASSKHRASCSVTM